MKKFLSLAVVVAALSAVVGCDDKKTTAGTGGEVRHRHRQRHHDNTASKSRPSGSPRTDRRPKADRPGRSAFGVSGGPPCERSCRRSWWPPWP